MPVQVPTLNRIGTPSPESVGRVDVKPLDTTTPLQIQSHAIEKLGSEGIQYLQQVENSAADTAATDAANRYHKHLKDGIVKLSGQFGDPTPGFDAYYKDAESKKQEIFNEFKDASPRIQNEVRQRVNTTGAHLYDQSATLQGAKQSHWEMSVANSAVKVAQDDMMQSTAHLDISDPNTTIPLDLNIKKIEDTINALGVKQGTVKEVFETDAEGNKVRRYIRDEAVVLQQKKEINEGLKNTILNLSVSGDVEGAKFLTDKYANRFTPDTHEQIVKATRKDQIRVEADKLFSQVKGLEEDKALKKIDDYKGFDSTATIEIQKQARENNNTYHVQMKNAEERQSKENYKSLGKYVLERQNSDSPFLDLNSLHQDPAYLRQTRFITDPKQLEAIDQMVKPPKESDEDTKGEMYKILQSREGFRGMSYEEFRENAAGLNKEDFNRFESEYKRQTSDSEPEIARRNKELQKMLPIELQKVNYAGIKKVRGHYSNKDEQKISLVRDDLLDAMTDLPPNMSVTEQHNFIRNFVAQKIENDKLNSEAKGITRYLPERFQGDPERNFKYEPTKILINPTTEKPVILNAPTLTKTQSDSVAAREFYKQSLKLPGAIKKRLPTPQELNTFIKNGNKL